MNPDRSAQKPATGAPAASDQRGSSVSPTPDGSEQAGPTGGRRPSTPELVFVFGETTRHSSGVRPYGTSTESPTGSHWTMQATATSSQTSGQHASGPSAPSSGPNVGCATERREMFQYASSSSGPSVTMQRREGASLKRHSSDVLPVSSGTAAKQLFQPSSPQPRPRSPEPILGRPTIDQFVQKPRGRVQYQQQQLRDFSMEYEQKMAVVWRYLEAEEASRPSTTAMQQEAPQSAGAEGMATDEAGSSRQAIRSPEKRKASPEKKSSPAKKPKSP